jgi:hypothetical protein
MYKGLRVERPEFVPHQMCNGASTLMLVFRSVYSSLLKMDATCYSETLADFQRTARRYIPEDRTFLPRRPEDRRI